MDSHPHTQPKSNRRKRQIKGKKTQQMPQKSKRGVEGKKPIAGPGKLGPTAEKFNFLFKPLTIMDKSNRPSEGQFLAQLLEKLLSNKTCRNTFPCPSAKMPLSCHPQ